MYVIAEPLHRLVDVVFQLISTLLMGPQYFIDYLLEVLFQHQQLHLHNKNTLVIMKLDAINYQPKLIGFQNTSIAYLTF